MLRLGKIRNRDIGDLQMKQEYREFSTGWGMWLPIPYLIDEVNVEFWDNLQKRSEDEFRRFKTESKESAQDHAQ